MNRMPSLEDRGEMANHFVDLLVAHIGVEYLCEYGELPFARQLFVIEIGRIHDDRVTSRHVDLRPDLGLDWTLHWKFTPHRKRSRHEYLSLSDNSTVVTRMARPNVTETAAVTVAGELTRVRMYATRTRIIYELMEVTT